MTIESAHPDDGAGEYWGEVRYNVLSTRSIWLAASLIVLVGFAVAAWLLLAYGGGGDQERNQLEAIKTAGTIVIGTGGAAALLLAARRQRTAEIALRQKDRDQADVLRAHALQEQVAADTRADAAERRITELYTKATDQLGSDKAAVRLAGLYALERVAQGNPDQRQTIVNVLCAYLRLGYSQPGESPANADEKLMATLHERDPEREVRLTAQRLLTAHLQRGEDEKPADTFWENMTVDLTGAALSEFGLPHCTVRTATFRSATFSGKADFQSTAFIGGADFHSAEFSGDASFLSSKFSGAADFRSATFAGCANFHLAIIASPAGADFGSAKFSGRAVFHVAAFIGSTRFNTATFEDHADFKAARFSDSANFQSATFTDSSRADFKSADFAGRTDFDSASFNGEAIFDSVEFAGPPCHSDPPTLSAICVDFSSARFAHGVPPEVARFIPPVDNDDGS